MSESLLGRKIGHFRFVEKIATGGMGEVYAGYDETLQRKVALKGIRPEYHLNDEAKGRFLREARVLSQLGHPHICQIYDYLEGERSVFIVMELVEGRSLTRAVREGLDGPVRQRIAEQVAGVLVAAHEKGVIHRDLKPDNILLAEGDQVKVLDFGLSRQLSEEVTWGLRVPASGEGRASSAAVPEDDATFGLEDTPDSASAQDPSGNLTSAGTILGTLGYMSPEQARGDLATAASDMYSFGLVLQELFTGKPAHEPGLKPEARLEKAKRGETLPVSGVDPDLARLIERLKSPEPAARPSAVDVAEKLVRIRNKPRRRRRQLLVAATIALLMVFGAVMTVQSIRATRAEKRARQEAETAQHISGFLVDMFKVLDPSEARGKTVTAREILDKGTKDIEAGLREQPLVQARLMGTMGTVYMGLGLYKDAEPLLSRAVTTQERELGPDHPEVGESLNVLAELYGNQGKYAQAESLYRRSLAILEKALGPGDPKVAHSLNDLGVLSWKQSKYAEAEQLHKRALAIREKALGPDHPEVANSLNNLAVLYRNQNRYGEAEPLYQRALAINEKALGPDHLEVARDLSNLAILYGNQGKYEQAEPCFKRSLAIKEKTLGQDHPNVATSLNSLAVLYWNHGKYAEAGPLYRRSLAIREKALGPDHPSVANSLNNLAALDYFLGEYAEAVSLCKRVVAIREKTVGPRSREMGEALRALAACEFKEKRSDDALRHLAQSLEIGREWAAKAPEDRKARILLGSVLLLKGRIDTAMGKGAEGQSSWKEALSLLQPVADDEPGLSDLDTYAQTLLSLGMTAEARPLVQKLLDRGYRDPDLLALCREKGLTP